MKHPTTGGAPSRREFLKSAAALAACGGAAASWRATAAEAGTAKPITARDFLRPLLYTREEVRQWLALEAFPFARYDAQLGWLLRSIRMRDGIDGAENVYTYGPLDERVTLHYRDEPCRINTYGNSFTQCHQVSDAETWQEVLAGHLQEPLRNFGIGGWSVYQAYLRMLREEARVPAEYIIFNIYEDDHFRNLDAWRNIRAPKHVNFIEPTLPHIVANADRAIFEERANLCPTPESVYHLCDLDWVEQTFKDDFVLQIMLAHANAKSGNPHNYEAALELASTHGIITRVDTGERLSAVAEALHSRTAYFTTQRIVEMIEAFAQKHGKRVLYVLSYPAKNVAQFVQEGVRRDQTFVDFMRQRGVPFVDLLAAHAADFAHFKGDLQDYLKPYFIGHYTPRGNFFCAQSIRRPLIEMLSPKPRPYRAPTGAPRSGP